jgi:hypothetical protein
MARTALITGASGGIGEALARVFGRHGYNLVLVARSEDKLEKLAAELRSIHQIETRALPMNLITAKAPTELFKALKDTQIDALVNNAGFATYGLFTEIDTKTDLDEIRLNVLTLTHLTKLFLPGMVERGFGQVLNMASTAAFAPGPLMAVYYATKAYVLSLSEALAEEYRDKGITVTALCPGPTESGFQERAQMTDSKLVQGGLMSAVEVAEAGYKGLTKGQTVVVPGMANKIGALSSRVMPRPLASRLVKRLQRRVNR